VINEIEASNSNFENGNDCDLEFDVESVEVGNKFVVIDDDLENGNPFYFYFLQQALA
jgi:hypothetical protein